MEFCESCQVFQRPVLQGDKKICRRCGTTVPEKFPVSSPTAAPSVSQPSAPLPWNLIAVMALFVGLVAVIVVLLTRPNEKVAMPVNVVQQPQPVAQTDRAMLLQQQSIGNLQRQLATVQQDLNSTTHQITDQLTKLNRKHSEDLAAQAKAHDGRVAALEAQINEMESAVKLMDQSHLELKKSTKRKKVDPEVRNVLIGQARALRERNERKANEKNKPKRVIRDEEFKALMAGYKKRAGKVDEPLGQSMAPIKGNAAGDIGNFSAPKAVPAPAAAPVNKKGAVTDGRRPRATKVPVAPWTSKDRAAVKRWETQWQSQTSATDAQRRQFIYKIIDHPQRQQACTVFLKALEDPDVVVRRFAYTGLKESTGEALPFTPDAKIGDRSEQVKAWRELVAKF